MVTISRFDWFFRPQLPVEDLPLSAEMRFAEALAELPAIERSALALSEIGGLGTDEIAQRLGTDVAVVRKVIVRARSSVRTTLAARSRRGLTMLVPFQNWWNGGSSAPLLRTAGAVAAAVIGTGVAISGAAADQPRPVLRSPDPPAARPLDSPTRRVAPRASAPAASDTAPARLQPARDAAGGAALLPVNDRYGDIGATTGESASSPHAPVGRGDEADAGARPAPPAAERPGVSTPEVPTRPAQAPPPPIPFPTPHPVPVPVPASVPVPEPAPMPVPPVEPPAVPAVPVPSIPALPLPAVPPPAP